MTLRLLPLLPALLPLAAQASGKCTLTDPSLTLQSYTVNPQRERIAMYWKNADGEALGSLRALLADIDRDGRADGDERRIYAKNYAPLGLYIERACRRFA
jgi:uncharacterized protein YigE (DUF2233 family)